MHKSTAAMKNTPKILIVSITKLLIELSIIVLFLKFAAKLLRQTAKSSQFDWKNAKKMHFSAIFIKNERK